MVSSRNGRIHPNGCDSVAPACHVGDEDTSLQRVGRIRDIQGVGPLLLIVVEPSDRILRSLGYRRQLTFAQRVAMNLSTVAAKSRLPSMLRRNQKP